MAICDYCDREMQEADSCTKNIILYRTAGLENDLDAGGVWFHALPYGTEDRPTEIPDDVAQPDRCHDCGVTDGGFHHPGCDWEQDPLSGHQLLMQVISYEPEAQPYHGRIEADPHSEITPEQIRGLRPDEDN